MLITSRRDKRAKLKRFEFTSLRESCKLLLGSLLLSSFSGDCVPHELLRTNSPSRTTRWRLARPFGMRANENESAGAAAQAAVAGSDPGHPAAAAADSDAADTLAILASHTDPPWHADPRTHSGPESTYSWGKRDRGGCTRSNA